MLKKLILTCLLCIAAQTALTQISPATGAYISHELTETGLIIQAEHGKLEIDWYSPQVVRANYVYADVVADTSFSVVEKPDSQTPFAINTALEFLILSSEKMAVVVDKSTLSLSYWTAEGKLLLGEKPDTETQELTIGFETPGKLAFYGTGMRGVELNLHGRELEIYNRQNYGYRDAQQTMNVTVPMTATNGGFALFFDNRWRAFLNLGEKKDTEIYYRPVGGDLRYFVIAGETVSEQLKHYTWLTGRQPLPPKWALGFIQSKFGYSTEEEARGVADTLRNKNFPADVVVLDLEWNKHMGDMDWDRDAFPEPYAMIRDLQQAGLKTVLISQPYMVEFSKNFREADSLGYLVKNQEGKPFRMERWWSCDSECDGVLLDFTNPDMRSWWWEKHPPIMQNDTTNVDGYWTDLGEPERHYPEMVHHSGVVEQVHNTYNLKWAKLIFNGHKEQRPNERIFHLSRSGFAGIQRFGTFPWSGDVGRSFSALAVQPRMVLNQGMSGLVWHHSDLGGFTGDVCDPELYVRWIQHGVFSPMVRAHGNSQCPTEPWGYGDEAEKINRTLLNLRYELMPYLYTMAEKTWTEGLPVSRPLFFEDDSDVQLLNEGNTHFFGDDIIVSPVLDAGLESMEVYLPEGRWVDFWNDNIYEGGTMHTIPVNFETIPVFVRSGAIIPMQNRVRYMDEVPLDTLILRLYPDTKNPANFTLYEDDGISLDYQKGKVAYTDFSLHADQNTIIVILGKTRGEFDGAVSNRTHQIYLRNTAIQPKHVLINGWPAIQTQNKQQLSETDAGYFWDEHKNKLWIQVSKSVDELADVEIVQE